MFLSDKDWDRQSKPSPIEYCTVTFMKFKGEDALRLVRNRFKVHTEGEWHYFIRSGKILEDFNFFGYPFEFITRSRKRWTYKGR